MDWLLTLGMLVGGLVILVLGAEWLVRGASRLALALGISPLVIGLTIVAFGTSAPELAVSVQSAYTAGSAAGAGADIALGNVVGSNIANILLILGLSALVAPLVVNQQLIRLDVPLMIGLSFLLYGLALDGSISPLEGGLMALGLAAYIVFLIYQARKENNKKVEEEYAQEFGAGAPRTAKDYVVDGGLIVLGLILLVLGARWLVDAAVNIALALGVSKLVVGLTIVAVGTSLPEIATSVMASIKGERDIAVGNVVGSNIFNILSVLGISALVAPQGIPVNPAALAFDIPVMIAVAVACFPIFFTGLVIARWEGALFLGYYVAYTAYLVLTSTQHQALPLFNATMLWFVLPLTAITLMIITIQEIRLRRKAKTTP